jgi:muconolactone delta-isomerase
MKAEALDALQARDAIYAFELAKTGKLQSR